jgi:hypothetical protein
VIIAAFDARVGLVFQSFSRDFFGRNPDAAYAQNLPWSLAARCSAPSMHQKATVRLLVNAVLNKEPSRNVSAALQT